MKTNKNYFLMSLFFSFLYVGFGTFSLIAMSPQSPVYWNWAMLGLLITFPVSFIGFGIMYVQRDYTLLLIVQLIVFLLFWSIVYRIWMNKFKRRVIGKKGIFAH